VNNVEPLNKQSPP